MSPAPLSAPLIAAIDDPATLRHGTPAALAAALADSRQHTLRLFDAYAAALPRGLEVAYAPELNPPLWELGHIAWFEESWLARNPLRGRWRDAGPHSARGASCLPRADALYDSTQVAHPKRWHLDLPNAQATRHYAEQVRQQTLALLHDTAHDHDALYFYRLALAHEDMHGEATVYMAQQLGLAIGPALRAAASAPCALGCSLEGKVPGEVALTGGAFVLGNPDPGFAFDNELGAHELMLPAFSIDRAPVNWARFLPFIDAGGYDDRRWWSDEGWAWRRTHSAGRPRYLRHEEDGNWRRASFGQWLALDPALPACHLTLHEAQAWCAYAGRRLPSEAEWELAATTLADGFEWGQVWEWTASAFAPYPGFTAHPYHDYSLPWFDGRPVLRGASFATAPRMKSARYRNYFPAARHDIFAGFRSCRY